MGQAIFGEVLYAEKSGDAYFIKGKVIGAVGTHHARFEKFQLLQRRKHLVDKLTILIIVVQS
jgi:hypothetical protein